MEKVIKWIDDTNQQFSYINYKIENNQECTFEYRSWNNDIECYTNESEKHIYNLLSIILQASNENKVFIFKRIFRHSSDFFYYCNELREYETHSWITRVWLNNMSGGRNAETLKNTLLYDLVMFYSEALQLCYECNLPSTALPQYDFATGVIEDILAYMKLSHKRIQVEETGIIPLDMYIKKDIRKVLSAIDNELTNCKGAQGKRIALIICALEEYGYIANINGNIERIYEAFKYRYPDKVASRQGVSQYINAHRNPKAITDKPKFSAKELKLFIDKI